MKMTKYSINSTQCLVSSRQYVLGSRQYAVGSKQHAINKKLHAFYGLLKNCLLPTYNTSYQLLFTVFYLLLTINTQAQEKQGSVKVETPQVAVVARVQQEGQILLRWAATTPRAWRKSNLYGYELKRYTITKNGQTLTQPIEKPLGIFFPKPLEEWMLVIEENDNAAVMAQALYGESFEVEGQDELSAIVNLSEEQQQRFSWALYAADQNFEAAQMAGLGYVDNTIMANEKYAYKVVSLVPESEMLISEGGVFIGMQDYEDLPNPLDLAGVFMDGQMMLSWNYAILSQTYNSYFVERSEDGKTFDRLNDLPLTSLNNSEKTDTKRMFYIDSISNNTKYHYRIIGKTPFGELSPPSDVVSGEGKTRLDYVPRITTKHYLDDKRVILEWEFPKEGNAHIKGFELNRSDKVNGSYKTVVKSIAPELRQIQFDSMRPTNYFTITAIGNDAGSRTSFPALVQPVDSVPPVKPIEFKGQVDSLGIVTLNWKANPEDDMLGYRVFRGNNKTEEYSQITVSPHQGTTYYDSISVKNLNTKVYYKLIAVDQRFNMSEPSDILELKKPDYIPPTQPVFKSYKITDGVVNLNWANSSSEDVERHELYRKEKDSTEWKLIYTVGSRQYAVGSRLYAVGREQFSVGSERLAVSSWDDSNIVEGRQYTYTLIAIDKSELESEPSQQLTVIIPKTSLKPPVENMQSYVDKKNGYIELYWKPYEQPYVAELMIYRGVNDKPVTLLRNVLPTIKRIVDELVKPNNEYVYMIRAVFKDGSISEIATLNIKY